MTMIQYLKTQPQIRFRGGFLAPWPLTTEISLFKLVLLKLNGMAEEEEEEEEARGERERGG